MRTLLKTDTNHLVDLNQILDDFLAIRIAEAQNINPYYLDLWESIGRLLGSGGKRLRPQLCVLSYRAFGGKDNVSILPAAAALELLHLSMLIHDDIIDRDYIRYGIDNIAGRYNKKLYKEFVTDASDRTHYAHSAAMLGGDLLLSEAYLLVANSAISAENIIAVQQCMRKAIFEVIGGELLDTESTFRGLGAIPAESIALYKTASYTFTLPMLVGARLAGLPNSLIQHLTLFSKNIGIAFQLRDDIIGIFGDENQTGKSTISDIREGKRTFMIEQFYSLANDAQKAEFKLYFGNKGIDKKGAGRVRALLRSSGAYEHTENEIARYEKAARLALVQLPVQPNCLEDLEQLISTATKRSA